MWWCVSVGDDDDLATTIWGGMEMGRGGMLVNKED